MLGDVVGNLSDVLLLQGLRDADDLADAARADGAVEVRDVAAAQDVGPILRLGQHLRELRLRHGRRHFSLALEVRRAQQDTRLEDVEREFAEVTGRADHRAVEVVVVVAAAVDADLRQLKRGDEVGLLDLLRLLEELDGRFSFEHLLDDGPVFLDDAAHLRLDGLGHRLRQLLARHADLTVEAVVGAEHGRNLGLWIELVHGHDEQEFHRAAVDDPSLFALELDELDGARLADRRLQVVQGVVELDGNDAARVLLLIIRREVARQDLRQDIPFLSYRDEHRITPFS